MTEYRTTCKDCGEYLEGDGYKTVMHCPNLEEISYDEPDAGPVYCGWTEDQAPQPAPAVQGESAAYISHTSEGDILGWERQFDAPNHTALYAAPQPAEQQPVSHDWDDQDKCRRCGDRDWYASATCTPKPQTAPDVDVLVEALECALEIMENVDGANDCGRGIDAVEEALAAHRKQGGRP